MKTFKDLGVRPDLIKGLEGLGIIKPTEVQARAIPVLLGESHDLVCQAQTGTGKTAAFGVPILHRIDPKNPKVQALVLAPTRELAKQIGKQLFKFTKFSSKVFTEVVTGGDKIALQREALKRPTQIVVATPGRLIELLDERAIDLSEVATLVLDEADEMLSMGFRKELEAVLDHTREAKEKWLFSATIPAGIRRIITMFLSEDAERMQIDKKHQVNQNIEHQYTQCGYDEKIDKISLFIKAQKGDRGVVFCRTRAGTIEFAEQLVENGFSVDVLQGDLPQKERDKVMRSFRKKRIQILVSTDVSARGIDVEELAFVIHHQLPDQIEYYTHRSGRTARAGKSGISIAFLAHNEIKQMREIEQELNIKFRRI